MKLRDILLEVEADQKVDAVVDDLKDDFASALNGIEDALEDAADQKQEAVLTTASLLLALPAILGIIARLGKGATSAWQKLAGKKPTDQSSAEKYFQQLGRVADELHHLYMKPIELVVRKFVKDPVKAKKISSAIFHIIVATMMIASGVTAAKALQSKEISLASLESALTAVKGGEVKSYLTNLYNAI
jgi:Mg2+ and Co2+ transporter CorA